jgi:glutaredoxin
VKTLFIVICIACVAYAGYQKLYAVKTETAEAPEGSGPTYVAMEAGGPVYRITSDTRSRLDRFSSEKVVMFGATWCGYCAANRQMFAEQGVRYVELDIDRDPAALEFMQKVLGSPGVPTTVLGTRLIPGYSAPELQKAIKKL